MFSALPGSRLPVNHGDSEVFRLHLRPQPTLPSGRDEPWPLAPQALGLWGCTTVLFGPSAEGTVPWWSALPSTLSAHTYWPSGFFRTPQTYLFLSSIHCWPWSSSLDRRRQTPWAGSPEAVSSTCVVSGLLTGSMPLP